ncbi:transcriptional regulator with XRE-family HTH domain [Brevibacillus aydinogluensis]|uniref:helix-turn-helix domain-containing protein n=1 Tax=Brevibacillus aydinogluensis TaxID=927786 RepID=UPI0028936CD9|nr:helix-turn-helix transcriptional regulator [Brevibacillus aydinogluensis]MDT3416134.1 transcriptional regulator with XRE-family HTH domain [Brevibacillus aydinogluensis]
MKRTPNIGTKIKHIRQEKGMTARFVAEKVGISPSTLCKYENNTRMVRADLLPIFAEVLGVDVQNFFEDNVGKTSTKKSA